MGTKTDLKDINESEKITNHLEPIKMKSNLKQLRESHNLSQNKLALKAGVSRKLIARIEDGTVLEFPMPSLRALCKYFKVPVQDLIIFDDEEPELAYAA